MDATFEAVRAACPPGVWSRGVEIVRSGAVLDEAADGEVRKVRVSTKGGLIARTVTLFLDDAEWECTCGLPACEHAAAAVIALRRAAEGGTELPAPGRDVGRIVYRFTRSPAGLALERGVRAGEAYQRLEATLAARAEGRVGGLPFAASQADLAVELALGTHRRGPLPRGIVGKVLGALARVPEVTLDGAPVATSGAPVVPRVVVEDQGSGFRLALEDEPGVAERFANGAALCAGVLRPTGEAALTGREWQELPRGRHVPAEEAGTLAGEILPDLRRRVPVEVRTARLPGTARVPPRIVVETRREGDALSVLALLVYGEPPTARVDGGRLVALAPEAPVPVRDEREETRLVRRLGAELGLAPGVRAAYPGEEGVAFAARLARWEGGRLQGSGHAAFALEPPLVPEVRPAGDDVDVAFVSPGRGRAGAEAVVGAWRAGASLVPLEGGGWAPLPADWLARHGARIADLLAARAEAGGALPRAALPELGRLCEDLDLPPPPGLAPLRALLEGFTALPGAPLPGDVTAKLRPYQRRGVDWLAFLRDAGLGALLADDMGLGKTLQALCALRGRTLVVAPTSVLATWEAEARRHRPSLRVSVYHGPRRALDPQADLTVTSYALLRLDADRLASERWDVLVLDEAQAIKNAESQAAQAAQRIEAGWRLAMTGTPVENRLEELWSQFHVLHRGLLGGRRDFQERYARPIELGDAAAAARLRERIRPFVLRRLKQEVAPELPPRTEQVLRCELSPAEREVYEAVRAATREEVVKKLQEGGGVLAALEALLRLRQAACHPGLVPGQEAATSSKVELLLETLDTVVAERHKALVFSQWTSLLDRVEPHLGRAGIPFLRLDGSTADRAGVVARFQDPDGPPVFLVSLRAGGTGLTLTAADHVFLLDPWWNPAVEDQAADRAHRIGQENPVFVYRLVATETVEERILLLQEAKRDLAAAALEGAAAAAALTRDDLLALLD